MSAPGLTDILRGALDDTPGALGLALAAYDGETVDSIEEVGGDLALTAAHCSILIAQVRSALRTFHWGDPIELVLFAGGGTLVARVVARGYFALIALPPGAAVEPARQALGRAAGELLAEIA